MTNLYLYGIEDVPEIPQDVIDARIAILNKRLRQVQDVNYKTRDLELRNKLINAINFWEHING